MPQLEFFLHKVRGEAGYHYAPAVYVSGGEVLSDLQVRLLLRGSVLAQDTNTSRLEYLFNPTTAEDEKSLIEILNRVARESAEQVGQFERAKIERDVKLFEGLLAEAKAKLEALDV